MPYLIRKGSAKLLDDFRGDRIFGDTYIISKEGKDKYEVVLSTLGDWCNCPGHVNHGHCKHMYMVYNWMEGQNEDP